MPTYPAFLGLLYALAGVTLVSLSSFADALQLAFPLAAGFALVGPAVAVGLYEMSRRREQGLEADWRDAFAVVRSPALPSILALGLLLFAIFAAWIGAAQLLYVHIYGPDPPAAAIPFFRDALTTTRGWLLVVTGGSIGFCFAALALCLSVISIPLMLNRDIGLVPAIAASLRLSRECPMAVALWGGDRRCGARRGFAAALHRPSSRHADARSFDMAALSTGRRARGSSPAEQRRAGGARRPNPRQSSEALRNAGNRKTHAASVIR